MSKLSYEDKIRLYSERKEGVSTKSLSRKYNIRENIIDYMVSLIDKHGIDILRTSKNKKYQWYWFSRISNNS